MLLQRYRHFPMRDELAPDSAEYVTVRRSGSSPSEWNEFVERSGASYRCLYGSAYFYLMPLRGLSVKRFDFIMSRRGQVKKIGQCTVLAGPKLNTILDQIQIIPGHEGLWAICMESLMRKLGPGRYLYGSEWSMEKPRDGDLEKIAGISILRSRPVYLEAIDFSAWPDWNAYWRSVSSNVRRNFTKAKESVTGHEFSTDLSYNAIRHVPKMSHIRLRASPKRLVKTGILLAIGRSVLRNSLVNSRFRSLRCTSSKKLIAFANFFDVGPNIFYIEGGSRRDIPGVGWYTLMTAIKDGYDRTDGRGSFVMGPVDEDTLATAAWQGLARSRTACRAERTPKTVIEFRFRG